MSSKKRIKAQPLRACCYLGFASAPYHWLYIEKAQDTKMAQTLLYGSLSLGFAALAIFLLVSESHLQGFNKHLLLYDTVHKVNSKDYSQAQIEAWAPSQWKPPQ